MRKNFGGILEIILVAIFESILGRNSWRHRSGRIPGGIYCEISTRARGETPEGNTNGTL